MHWGDMAEIRRARGEKYPAGTIYIQVSATHGEIKMLNQKKGTLEGKYSCDNSKIRCRPTVPFFNMLNRATFS